MARDEGRKPEEREPAPDRREERQPYEPPRIEKKRSVSRATLFTGGGPSSGGLTGQG